VRFLRKSVDAYTLMRIHRLYQWKRDGAGARRRETAWRQFWSRHQKRVTWSGSGSWAV